MLILKRENDVILTPDRFERIREGDILVIAGKDDSLERLEGSMDQG